MALDRAEYSSMMLKAALNPRGLRPCAPSFRQWDELALADNLGKTARLPVGFRRLDPLGRARDEIPPDMARPVHRSAAEQPEPGAGRRPQAELGAGAADHDP